MILIASRWAIPFIALAEWVSNVRLANTILVIKRWGSRWRVNILMVIISLTSAATVHFSSYLTRLSRIGAAHWPTTWTTRSMDAIELSLILHRLVLIR